jgi:hypothetical protein
LTAHELGPEGLERRLELGIKVPGAEEAAEILIASPSRERAMRW